MAGKRKRIRASVGGDDSSEKRFRLDAQNLPSNTSIENPILCSYYPRVVTLQEYLHSKLPKSSVSRRRRILSIGKRPHSSLGVGQVISRIEGGEALNASKCHIDIDNGISDREKRLAKLLETTMIGLLHDTPSDLASSRQKDFISFSHQLSMTSKGSVGAVAASLSEVRFICTI